MDPSTAGTPLAEAVLVEGTRQLQVTIEVGDVLATFGDVLLLKYAQASHGLDRVVADGLEQSGSSVAGLLPLPGRSLTVAAGSVAKCEHVVFVGTPPLGRFGYDALRTWARESLLAASATPGQVATVLATVHGTEINGSGALDEDVALASEVRGFRDALRSGDLDIRVATVRIVERDEARARRLAEGLAAAARPDANDWQPTDAALTRTVSSARDELSPDALVTASGLAAAIQHRHPEYAGTAFGRVELDPEIGPKNTVDVWLTQVRALYDTAELTASQSVRLSGRLVVAGLAMIDRDLRTVLTRAGVLAVLLAEMDIKPRDPSLRQKVPWTPDNPVGRDTDELGRRLVAKALARQLADFDRDHGGYSFALLVDGRWGAGKTTLLSFLVEEANKARESLELPPVCTVTFDAWRQSRAGPPWLRLMTALRTQLVKQHHLRGWTRIREWLRRLGTATMVTAVVVAIVAVTLVVLWATDIVGFDTAASQVTAVVALAATIVTGAKALGRVLTSDSQRQARSFIDNSPEPMDSLAEHFQWLRCRCEVPIMFLIDDLDRCAQDYVVELLDTMQKLVRDEGQGSRSPTLYIVVAADGRWLRSAYEVAHAPFADTIGEPGRPLGSLFLDKLFQVRVPVPELSPRLQQRFLEGLLGSVEEAEIGSETTIEVKARIGAATTNDEVLEVLRSTAPLERMNVAEAALEKLNSPDGAGGSEAHHALERFAPLLEPNPRSVRRFLMAFSVLRAARLAEGNPVATEPLALWTIVTVRWPLLAEYLADEPERVDLFHAPAAQSDGRVPTGLQALLAAPTDELRQVLTHPVGGPLQPDVIRQCAGLA
jgi:hypothetical protein